MAIAKDMNWYVRAGGLETNGGGYDGTTYPGGTNWADADAPKWSITDLTSTNSTTVTSVLSTFDSTIVGNVLRIASGTGATTGYYVVATYVDANTITLDRVSGTYTAGVAKVGGAHASLLSYANGGTATQPALTTPLAAGHTINIRGSGSTDGNIASADFDFSASQFWNFPSGDTTSGKIRVTGYNGRPTIGTSMMWYNGGMVNFSNLKIYIRSSPSYGQFGPIAGMTGSVLHDIIFDQNGNDHCFVGASSASRGMVIYDCELRNSGSSTAGTIAGIDVGGSYSLKIINNWIHGIKGDGINIAPTLGPYVAENIIVNCGRYGINIASASSSGNGGTFVINNTIDNNGSDGINISAAGALADVVIWNNIISNHAVAGKYGINVTSGTTAANDFLINGKIDYNDLYGNTSARNNHSAGSHDLALDPGFVNTGGNNYAVGTNLKAVAYPSVLGKSSTTAYMDIGAAQRQESGGSPGLAVFG